jgi:nicotinate-nucleotide adenylyltransferase
MDDTELAARIPPLPAGGRVLLLGGSFNPPHIAHALLATAALLVDEAEELWVLPCADHPFGKELAPLEDRLEMCRFAFAPLSERVRVVDLESALPSPSYTVQTLRALHRLRPGIAPAWIAGSDILEELPRWREPEEVQRLAELFLFPRPGYDAGGRERLGFALPDVASGQLRARIARGEDISKHLERRVRQLIAERGLYRPR